MFHDNNQYALRKEIVGGFTHYYITFTNAHGESHDTQVPRNVFATYLRFEKDERNLRRWDERHREQSDLTETTLHRRALHLPRNVEDMVVDAEHGELLRRAIAELPEVQKRRFLMYHDDGLTFEEIATLESCTKRAIKFSVDIAEEKVRKFFENLDYTFRP